MTVKSKIIIVAFLFFIVDVLNVRAVYFDFSENSIIERLQKDISTLASEEMEGREAGTPGEEMAVNYIRDRFREISLQPLFEDSYFQNFFFPGEWKYAQNNTLIINHTEYVPGEDFFPMTESGDTSVTQKPVYVNYGFKNDTLKLNDFHGMENLDGKIFVVEYYLPDTLYEKLDISVNKSIWLRIETALDYNPGGILFVNSTQPGNDPTIFLRRFAERGNIPVAFAGYNVYEHLENKGFDTEITLSVELMREMYRGINVAACLDNGAATTVVIGAHHDHLGYGGPTSRHTGKPEIHPGADDNASGVAGVLETARYISNQNRTGNNYIFITFSAEEKGLFGSRHFTESDAYDMEKINYMFNFDMIGRMKDNNLIMIGTGTSPKWETIIPENQPEHFNIRTVASGIGGSDHTSFYLKNIPAIFFFTGIHDDYHKPGDTHDKINYEGQKQILQFAWKMIEQLDQSDKLAFTETPVDPSRRQRTESVTMGIMPDHAFDGKGLKVHKVINGQPAHNGGVEDGDIIIALDDHKIKEIYSYMRALENFQEGDVVIVTILRNEEKIEIEIKF